jgi:hypothetical protein
VTSLKPWKRSWSVLSIGISAWMTTGCGASMPPSEARARLDATLTQECPELSPLVGKDGASVTRKLVEVGQAYNDCRDKHRRLVEGVK